MANDPTDVHMMDQPNLNSYAIVAETESSESEGFDDHKRYIPETLEKDYQSLGIGKKYVPEWRPHHAIREFLQNWKDGICETNCLGNREFKILNNGFDAKRVYTVEARHPDTDALLGFISWKNGTIQFSNFGSKMDRSALTLGVSSKRDDDNLAGTHGEGFKLASLVMVRDGYRVRYESSSFYWTFSLGGKHKDVLYYRLCPMADTKLNRLKAASKENAKSGKCRPLVGNIWEDVTVSIGKVLGLGEEVKETDFLDWIKVSLDLDSPSSVIRTSYGSLILDPLFKNRIYLKGLRLKSDPIIRFKFCYDFSHGQTNRERERLCNPNEEAKILANIWAEAVKNKEASALPHLLAMLQSDEQWADVNLAGKHMLEDTAELLWKMLRKENSDGRKFFYFDQNGDKDIELIVKSLKKEPAPLKKNIWEAFRRFKLLRTPEEQRQYLLQNAPRTKIMATPYNEDFERAFRSVLALDSRTRDLRLEFRTRAKAELDLLLHGSHLIINDKWLDFEASHSESFCSTFFEARDAKIEINHFSCTHIVKHLYDLVLLELSKGTDAQRNKSLRSDDYLRQIAGEKVDQMPGLVHMEKGDIGGSLIVKWMHTESDRIAKIHSLELMGQITMHRESTCADQRQELLTSASLGENSSLQEDEGFVDETHGDEGEPPRRSKCDCPNQLVSLKDSEFTFYGFDPAELYFPMVARTGLQAFYARPPSSLAPNTYAEPELQEESVQALRVSQDSGSLASPPTESFNPLYDVSDDDNVGAGGRTANFSPRSSRIGHEGISKDKTTAGRSRPPREGGFREAPVVGLDQVHRPSGNDPRNFTADFEAQKLSTFAKDKRMRKPEELSVSLNRQLSLEKIKTAELAAEVRTQRTLLTTKEDELMEMNGQLCTQSANLAAMDATLEADSNHLDKVTAENESLHALIAMLEDALNASKQAFENSKKEITQAQVRLETLQEEMRQKDIEIQHLKAIASPSHVNEQAMMVKMERLKQRYRHVRSQRDELKLDLEEAKENLRKALEIARSATSKSAKRPRVKDESTEEDENSSDMSDSARKRARRETAKVAKIDAQVVINLEDED